jgi:hypothetical protein
MADERKENNADEEQGYLYLQQRQAVNNAYASLEGQAIADSFSAFTFEEAADAQIERIEGASTTLRPNMLDRTEAVRQNLKNAVKQIKAVPPEKFRDVERGDAVNTSEADPQSDEELRKARLQAFQS